VWPRDVNRQYFFELLSSVLATAAILDQDEAIGPPKTKTQRSLLVESDSPAEPAVIRVNLSKMPPICYLTVRPEFIRGPVCK
jgi:hypothetical protein